MVLSLCAEDRSRAMVKLGLSSSPARSFARFFETSKSGKGSGEPKMGQRPIPTELDRPVQPHDRFLVVTNAQFRGSDEMHPAGRPSIAWADAQRFENMSLGLLVAAGKKLRHAYPCVRGRQISVDRESSLALGDALGGAIGIHAQEFPMHSGR